MDMMLQISLYQPLRAQKPWHRCPSWENKVESFNLFPLVLISIQKVVIYLISTFYPRRSLMFYSRNPILFIISSTSGPKPNPIIQLLPGLRWKTCNLKELNFPCRYPWLPLNSHPQLRGTMTMIHSRPLSCRANMILLGWIHNCAGWAKPAKDKWVGFQPPGGPPWVDLSARLLKTPTMQPRIKARLVHHHHRHWTSWLAAGTQALRWNPLRQASCRKLHLARWPAAQGVARGLRTRSLTRDCATISSAQPSLSTCN